MIFIHSDEWENLRDGFKSTALSWLWEQDSFIKKELLTQLNVLEQ